MITFKSAADLLRLNPGDPALPVIRDFSDSLMDLASSSKHKYDPDNDGYIVLIERVDANRVIDEIWPDRTLVDVLWEGVTKQGDFFVAVWLANNQFGIIFVIPDADWVNGELRKVLEDNLVPTTS